ncbi:membrane bound O-acyl transferase family-domain-containing protein [Xylariaceae sp. FL0016]|nr:membrane bound O-acyl transferase family-domain-containing protein [Xylariaceae sp. FL0016]
MFQQHGQDLDLGLAESHRQLYRAQFRANVAAGAATPFIVPLHFLGIWILPTLYLAIPHKDRPWLYRARWLVLAFTTALHLHMILYTSSMNFAAAYGVGLLAAWATVWNFTVLVWTRPQWDARRVEARRTAKSGNEVNGGMSNGSRGTNGSANGYAASETQPPAPFDVVKSSSSETNGNLPYVDGIKLNGLRERGVNGAREPVVRPEMPEESTKNLEMAISRVTHAGNGVHPENPAETAMDRLGEELSKEHEAEYFWQEYPAEASYWARLDWAFDIVSTMRMTGWNWAIHCLPPYKPPPKIGSSQLPLSYGPHRTKQGFSRTLSRRHLLIERVLFAIIPTYLIVDLIAVLMLQDPYFIVGPEKAASLPMPPHLASYSPLFLSFRRATLGFVGIVTALQLVFNFGALCLAFLCPPLLGFRAHPWHLPSMSGSFTQVLDRGLAGFWGSWWHQTFRFGFSAPAQWLVRNGYVEKGSGGERIVGAFCAFLLSGFLHASASYSTVPETKWWLPPVFFLLSGVGTVLQSSLCRSSFAKPFIENTPQWARRAGNLLFVVLWLWATHWALVDDFGRCGLWLFEPVPVSVFRWLGLGDPKDRRVWRYGEDLMPRWHTGKHWWDTGIAI